MTTKYLKQLIREVLSENGTTGAVDVPESLIQLISNEYQKKFHNKYGSSKPMKNGWNEIKQFLSTQGKGLVSHKSSGDAERHSTTTIFSVPKNYIGLKSRKDIMHEIEDNEGGATAGIPGGEFNGKPDVIVTDSGSSWMIRIDRSGGMDI